MDDRQPRSISSDSSERDENEDINHQVFLNSPSVKKPVAKNYMTPTISAASKAITSRKKILAGRADTLEPACFDDDSRKNSGLDNSGFSVGKEKILAERISDDLRTNLVLDNSGFSLGKQKSRQSRVEPYDPETNFCSPRPKYLRFKPDRRREIFEGEEEAGNGENEDGSIKTSGSSLPFLSEDAMEILGFGQVFNDFETEKEEKLGDTEGGLKVENTEIEEEEIPGKAEKEEEDEFVEESENTEGGLITVLLLLALGFSALLVTVLNCSSPFCGLRFYKGTEDNYYEARNHSLEAFRVKNPESGSMFIGQKILENVVGKRNFDLTDCNEETVFSEDSGIGELDSSDVAEVVIVEEDSNRVVGDSESEEGYDIDEKVEDSQDHNEVSVAPDLSEETTVEEVDRVGDMYVNMCIIVAKVAAKLVENLKLIEAEFALKVFIAVVTFITAILYFFVGVELEPKRVNMRSSSSKTKLVSNSMQEKYADNAPTDEAQYFSSEENTEDYSQGHAPSVSFLGELVVRDIQRSVRKNRETEARPVSVQSHLHHLEFPMTDSWKLRTCSSPIENGGGEEGVGSSATPSARRSSRNVGSALAPTPLRRSSRISNRSK